MPWMLPILPLLLVLGAPVAALELSPVEVRAPQGRVSATAAIFEAARPRLMTCLHDAHRRQPLAEAGSIVFVRRPLGARVQAAVVLEPARGDLARCLREVLAELPLDPSTPVRALTGWVAPPPPPPSRYPYPQR